MNKFGQAASKAKLTMKLHSKTGSKEAQAGPRVRLPRIHTPSDDAGSLTGLPMIGKTRRSKGSKSSAGGAAAAAAAGVGVGGSTKPTPPQDSKQSEDRTTPQLQHAPSWMNLT